MNKPIWKKFSSLRKKYTRQIMIRAAYRGQKINFSNLLNDGNVAIFPEKSLIYNRIKKSGNSTVSAFLTDVIGGNSGDNYYNFKSSIKSTGDIGFISLWSLPTFYSFVVVRNPRTRVLSGFLQKVAPGNSAKYSVFEGYGDSTPEGFLRFLRHLEREALYWNRHFWPQSALLYKPAEKFDWIAKLERLSEDMKPVLAAINANPDLSETLTKPHPIEANASGKITSSDNKVDSFYTPEAEKIMKSIYKHDFQQFDYD